MSKIDKVVQVEKELNEVAELICNVVTDLVKKKSLAEIGASSLLKLKDAVDGISEIPAEIADDLAAVQKSVYLPIADMVAALVKKTPAAPVA